MLGIPQSVGEIYRLLYFPRFSYGSDRVPAWNQYQFGKPRLPFSILKAVRTTYVGDRRDHCYAEANSSCSRTLSRTKSPHLDKPRSNQSHGESLPKQSSEEDNFMQFALKNSTATKPNWLLSCSCRLAKTMNHPEDSSTGQLIWYCIHCKPEWKQSPRQLWAQQA